MLKNKRWFQAVVAGLVTALIQYAVQPLPALLIGYQQESGNLTLAPTWTSLWWALSAVALGVTIGVARAVVKKWTHKSVVLLFLIAGLVFYVANFAMVGPFLTSEWWALPLVASTFSGAAPLAGAISGLAGMYFRRHSQLYVGRRSPEGH